MIALILCSLLILIFVWGFFRTGRNVPVLRKDRPKGAALLAELQKQMDELRPGPGDIIQPRPVFRSPFNCDDYDACREHYCPDRDRRDLERGRYIVNVLLGREPPP